MRAGDYFRLAKISLKARRKTTKSTVRGITFGLILLIPVVFIAMGVFGDLNRKVNANPEVLYASLEAAAARTDIKDEADTDDGYVRGYSISYNTAKSIYDKIKTEDKIMYEQVKALFNYNIATLSEGQAYNPNQQFFEMELGGTSMPVYLDTEKYMQYSNAQSWEVKEYSKTDYNNVPFAAILDAENADNFVPEKYNNKFGSIFVQGAGFTGDGKGQVILSETFIKALGKTNQDFYNKSFTINYPDIYYNSNIWINDSNENDGMYYDYNDRETNYILSANRNFFKDYTVVGIIKDSVTKWAASTSLDYSGIPSHFLSNMMFLSSSSLIMDDGTALDPEIEVIEGENEYSQTDYYLLATYKADDIDELNKEYICLGANNFHTRIENYYDSYRGNIPYSKTKVFIDPAKFAELKSVAQLITTELTGLLGDNAASIVGYEFVSDIYSQMNMIYTIFTYMVLFLSIMGGIIFFAAMVNLFNSIVHSVDSRKGYLGVLRAVGGKRTLINNMYFAESISIFTRALIWIAIFATAFCVGLKLLLDMAFKSINEAMPFTLEVGWLYIPLALGACLAVLLGLGFLFSYGCSWKVSRAPITETLASN